MIVIGLTGSIGMGKTTAATMLQQLGVPVHDSDAEVHNLLSNHKQARIAIGAAFPYFRYFGIYGHKDQSGMRTINRAKLGQVVFKDKDARKRLENILHPLVQNAQSDFIRTQRNAGKNIVALDIPLLFETGADQRVDITINISAPAFIQSARVLSRPNMDEKKFAAILEAQMPDTEKSALADYVLPSGLGRAYMMKELKKIITSLRETNDEEEGDVKAHG